MEACADNEFYSLGGGELWDYNEIEEEEEEEKRTRAVLGYENLDASVAAAPEISGRRKRRRPARCKNKEEVENQRMTHIAVERKRRKQMNDYLAALRSLMPPSYVQRGDQASIVGGAINFVKELEQLLQSLEAQKRIKGEVEDPPFTDFFIFPQYSSRLPDNRNSNNAASASAAAINADIEVSVVESHAILKLLVRRQPKQLMRTVAGLQDLQLTVLHLNATVSDEMALYTFSLKVEDDCELTSADDIAAAVHRTVAETQEEAVGMYSLNPNCM